MQIKNFKDMYIAELQELVSVEDQLADALTKMRWLRIRR
jgi:ferritin-like metal-binding protein YciE